MGIAVLLPFQFPKEEDLLLAAAKSLEEKISRMRRRKW